MFKSLGFCRPVSGRTSLFSHSGHLVTAWIVAQVTAWVLLGAVDYQVVCCQRLAARAALMAARAGASCWAGCVGVGVADPAISSAAIDSTVSRALQLCAVVMVGIGCRSTSPVVISGLTDTMSFAMPSSQIHQFGVPGPPPVFWCNARAIHDAPVLLVLSELVADIVFCVCFRWSDVCVCVVIGHCVQNSAPKIDKQVF